MAGPTPEVIPAQALFFWLWHLARLGVGVGLGALGCPPGCWCFQPITSTHNPFENWDGTDPHYLAASAFAHPNPLPGGAHPDSFAWGSVKLSHTVETGPPVKFYLPPCR